MDDIFQDRCQNDPQGVIKDLIAQTARQSAEIHRLNQIVLTVDEARLAENLIAATTIPDHSRPSQDIKVLQEKLRNIFNPSKPTKKDKKAETTEGANSL